MKTSIYQGCGLNHPGRTVFIASEGKCGHRGYLELQVYYYEGCFNAIITDGFKYLTGVRFCNNLKESMAFLNEFKNRSIK